MSSKYKIGDGQYADFVTFTIVNWIDVFTSPGHLAPVFSEA
ncbi:hypothetical protein [uncultured Cytophaga sp.]|nr:hypothetical protein [uncultured Cytophaga sp.]